MRSSQALVKQVYTVKMAYKKVKAENSIIAIKKFLVKLERKVSSIENKIDNLLQDKSQSEVSLKRFQSQIGDIHLSLKDFQSNICEEVNGRTTTENSDKVDKNKNIIIYGLKFEDKNEDHTIKKLFKLLEIDIKALGAVKVEVKRQHNNSRSVCLLQLETLKAKKMIFRNCHKLKNKGLKVSICDDLSFSDRVIRKHMLKMKSEETQKKNIVKNCVQNIEKNIYDVAESEKVEAEQQSIVHSMEKISHEDRDEQFCEEPVAHSSSTIKAIKEIGIVEDTSACYKTYMSAMYAKVAEILWQKYKEEDQSLIKTFAFLIKNREFHIEHELSHGKKACCVCQNWKDIVHLAPQNLKRWGIKHTVYQKLLYDLMRMLNEVKTTLNNNDEMDCICISNEIEQNILREIEKNKTSQPCRVD